MLFRNRMLYKEFKPKLSKKPSPLINWHRLAIKLKLHKAHLEAELDNFYRSQYFSTKFSQSIGSINSSASKPNSNFINPKLTVLHDNSNNFNMQKTIRKMSTVTSHSMFSDFNKKHRSYTIHSHQNRSNASSRGNSLRPSRNVSRQSQESNNSNELFFGVREIAIALSRLAKFVISTIFLTPSHPSQFHPGLGPTTRLPSAAQT